jgi:hypothetical protein
MRCPLTLALSPTKTWWRGNNSVVGFEQMRKLLGLLVMSGAVLAALFFLTSLARINFDVKIRDIRSAETK